jgi:hypothetical protein
VHATATTTTTLVGTVSLQLGSLLGSLCFLVDLGNGLGALENVLSDPVVPAHVDGVEQHETLSRWQSIHVHDLLNALEVHVDH